MGVQVRASGVTNASQVWAEVVLNAGVRECIYICKMVSRDAITVPWNKTEWRGFTADSSFVVEEGSIMKENRRTKKGIVEINIIVIMMITMEMLIRMQRE